MNPSPKPYNVSSFTNPVVSEVQSLDGYPQFKQRERWQKASSPQVPGPGFSPTWGGAGTINIITVSSPGPQPPPPPPPRQRQDPELPCGQGDSYLIDAGVRNVVVLQDKPHNVTISPGNAQKV